MPDTSTLSSLFHKLLDNINAGKVVSEFGPGLLLTVPVLMTLSILTGTSLMPAEQLTQLNQQIAITREELRREYVDLADMLADPALQSTLSYAPIQGRGPLRPSEVMLNGPSKLAIYGALAVVQDHRLSSNALDSASVAQGTAFGQLDRFAASWATLLGAEATEQQRLLGIKYDQEIARKITAIAKTKLLLELKANQLKALRDRLQTLETTRLQTSEVAQTLSVWENNLGAIAGLSVVVGVIISQANRLLFIEWLFRLFIKQQTSDPAARGKLKVQALLDDTKAKAQQALVSSYYRYAEGSLNMAIPVLCFGLVFGPYCERHLPGVDASARFAVMVGGILLALVLIASGFLTYKTYRVQADHVEAS